MGILRRLGNRLRTESRDALEFVLLPGLAAVLPWRLCFAVFKRLARQRWLYRAACEADLAQAVARGHCRDAQTWIWECRLTRLLDHADHYLFRTRGDAWMRRHVRVDGQWEGQNQAGLLWTFHWGAGMWALHHAAVSGLRANMVLAPPSGPDFAGRTVFGWYVRARMRSVVQALHRPIIFVPGGMPAVREALQRGEQVAVVMDVPQDQVRVTRTTQILGQQVSVPATLAQLAVDRRLPVTVYYMGIDLQSGKRWLHVSALGVSDDPKVLTDAAFAHLDRLLKSSPAAWHLWAQAPRFFKTRADDRI